MANDASPRPSFSAALKWRAASQVVFTALCVAAVVVMINYLGSRYFTRFFLSSQTRVELSGRTMSLLRSLTNKVEVTLYFDKDAEMYSTIASLLKEYQLACPKISVKTVDYARDPAQAEITKEKYGLGAIQIAPNEKLVKDFVIFDCEGRVKIAPAKALTEYQMEQDPNEKDFNFRTKPVNFKGEVMFDSILIAINDPKPLRAYFLQGHGEPSPADVKDEESVGFGKFATVLMQNYITSAPLYLDDTNSVPEDCNLLIIAGTTTNIPAAELDKVDRYLNEGGRLLALFNFSSYSRPNGLEKVVAKWGVALGDIIKEPKNTAAGQDVIVKNFSTHPLVNSLQDYQMDLVLPRVVRAIDANIQVADAPKVEEVAFSSEQALSLSHPGTSPQRYPMIVAVEKGNVKGIVTERGTTRLVVVGDSFFLGNQLIVSGANGDFAGYAVNWLLDRTSLLQGLGPRPITEYRVLMTKAQLTKVQWILMGAMPGAILLFGGLVWLRRRS